VVLVKGNLWQLCALLAVEIALIVGLIVFKPYADAVMQKVNVFSAIVRCVILFLGFFFVETVPMSEEARKGISILMIVLQVMNLLCIILVFVIKALEGVLSTQRGTAGGQTFAYLQSAGSEPPSMEKKDKKSTTYPLGVRITAMKVYQHHTGDYIKKGKAEGKDVIVDKFQSALAEYFHNGKNLRKELIPHFLDRLNNVVSWAESQGDVRIYSSSVLFIYDGEEDEDIRVGLKLIDFAHVHKITDGGKDEGYIYGIKNLVQYLQNIHASD